MTPLADTTETIVTPLGQTTEAVVTPLADATEAVVTPLADGARRDGTVVTPLADTTETVVTPLAQTTEAVVTPLADATDAVVTPIEEAATPVVDAAAAVTTPVVEVVEGAATPVAEATDAVTAPVTDVLVDGSTADIRPGRGDRDTGRGDRQYRWCGQRVRRSATRPRLGHGCRISCGRRRGASRPRATRGDPSAGRAPPDAADRDHDRHRVARGERDRARWMQPGASVVFTNVRLIPCLASETVHRLVPAFSGGSGGSMAGTTTRRGASGTRPSSASPIDVIREGFDRGVGRVVDNDGEGLRDGRLLAQVGMVLGLVYLAFLTVWFWATRLRWNPRDLS